MIFMQCGLTQHLIIILLVIQWLSHNAIHAHKTVLIPLEDAVFEQTHQYVVSSIFLTDICAKPLNN